ncbi:MAG TPA: PDZ domain-containing protein [Acidimicrobiia bacterium]|nr:PDZ domain-containing protein [Acidimicrobiia bacterium]
MTDSDTPSEDTPTEPPSPDATTPVPDAEAGAAPTTEVTVPAAPESDTTPPEPALIEPIAVPMGAAPTAAPRSNHVMVPKWAALAVAGLLLVGLGFGAGWFVKGDDDTTSSAGSQQEAPTRPDPRPFVEPESPAIGSTTFLGVQTAATEDDSGVRVVDVLGDSPADDAGLEADDVITEVDGEAVETPRDLVEAIRSQDPGDEVTITYERDGDGDSVDVTLTERDDSSGNARPS